MDWLKSLLKSHGVVDDVVDAVSQAAEEKLKSFIPKHRFDEVNEQKKQLEAQLAERDKQLSDLKKSASDSEELRKQIERLQAENKAAKEKYEAEMKQLRLTTAVKLALSGKVHDADLVAGLIDVSKIELDENGAIKAGLDEQVKALRESKSFLFIPEKEEKAPVLKGFKPFDGAPAESGGDKDGSFGRKLATMNRQNSDAIAQAQANYFK